MNKKLDEILRSPITGEINREYAKRFGETIEEMAENLSVIMGEKVSVDILKKYIEQ